VRQSLILAGLLTIGGAAFGADPKLLNLVMPDVKVLAGANVTSARISPLGQFLITQLQGNGVQFKSLIAATGFDPFTDVTEVLAASTVDPAKPGALVMMDGTFKGPDCRGVAKPEESGAAGDCSDLCGSYADHAGGSEGQSKSGDCFCRDQYCGGGRFDVRRSSAGSQQWSEFDSPGACGSSGGAQRE